MFGLAMCAQARAVVPSSHTSLRLAGGAYLHLFALPLGFGPGAIVGDPSFDASGTRAILLATFPGSAVFGDPQRMDPVQAFLLDVSRRRLTQLTVDGAAHSVRWTGVDTIAISQAGGDEVLHIAPALPAAASAYRFSTDQSVRGDLAVVSPDSSDRLTVYRRSDGRYVLREIGARRLRVVGVAPFGRFALLGENLAWLDSRPSAFDTIDRTGASNALAPRFDDPFGRQLAAIRPLSSAVYQGAYRDDVAYFAFAHGLTRVVAATRDFRSYFYPPVPDDPAYSVGDGLGVLDNGGLYLAWPENLQLTVRRNGRFVTLPMSFPPGYSDPKALLGASTFSSASESSGVWPPLQPDADALDAALLQWRVYPAGRGSDAGWIASYLGRVYRGDARANFHTAQPPAFPFAVLTRTDDGVLWGASPVRLSDSRSRASIARPSASARATLWSSQDGVHWRVRYALDGSPGAVGSSGSELWVAVTKPDPAGPMICVAKLGDDANPVSAPTGGSYDGEQLFFAPLSSGMFLVWGATPGRAQADQGVLSAYRLDADSLFSADASGLNAFERVRNAGDSSFDGTAVLGDPSMLHETMRELLTLSGGQRPVLATNIAGALSFSDTATVRSPASENRWQAEFGAQPSPLGIVQATAAGNDIIVTRSLWLAPLRGHGATERWQRDVLGSWHLAQTVRAWSLL